MQMFKTSDAYQQITFQKDHIKLQVYQRYVMES